MRQVRLRVVCGAGIASLLQCACAVGPRPARPPTVAAQPTWTEPVAASAGARAPADGDSVNGDPVALQWWRSLGDPVLSDLVEAARQRNLDLRAAADQVREARALRDAAVGARAPRVDVSGAVSRNELSANGELPINRIPGFSRRFNLFDLGYDASWELDFWGRNARAVEAADARVASATEARRSLEVQTVAEVVRTYVDLRSAQARLASAAQDADARTRSAALMEERRRAGESSLADAARAEAEAASTRSALAGLNAEARAAAYALATLTARPPEALIALAQSTAPLPDAPPGAGVGLRSELLRRRPDVRRAERELAAATADVAVATADLFPRVTLMASVGQQSLSTGNMLTGGSTRYQFGPGLSWPIFSAGSIRAQIHAAGARADAAAERYEQAVLAAFADSETALNRYAAAGTQRRDRDAALSQSAQALELARQRYDQGEDDLLSLLDTQSAYRTTEQADLTARAGELTALVSLYKALGGGWEAPAGPPRAGTSESSPGTHARSRAQATAQ